MKIKTIIIIELISFWILTMKNEIIGKGIMKFWIITTEKVILGITLEIRILTVINFVITWIQIIRSEIITEIKVLQIIIVIIIVRIVILILLIMTNKIMILRIKALGIITIEKWN